MPQNSKLEIARRRTSVADFKLQGIPSWRIAEILNVSPSQVCQDLKAISREWKSTRIEDIDQVKQEELRKLDLIEKEAWQEWRRSRESKTKKSAKKKGLTTKTGKALGIDSKEQTLTEEQLLGDPRYMSVILDCIAKRGKIIGYEAAQKLSLKLEDMTDEQMNIFQQKLMDLAKQVESIKED